MHLWTAAVMLVILTACGADSEHREFVELAEIEMSEKEDLNQGELKVAEGVVQFVLYSE